VDVKDVTVDSLLPDVLNFPPGTDLHNHPLVKNCSLILQVSRRSSSFKLTWSMWGAPYICPLY
jgi:hypothetical protein